MRYDLCIYYSIDTLLCTGFSFGFKRLRALAVSAEPGFVANLGTLRPRLLVLLEELRVASFEQRHELISLGIGQVFGSRPRLFHPRFQRSERYALSCLRGFWCLGWCLWGALRRRLRWFP